MSSAGTVLAVAVLGVFMAFVDATIVNIAVPDMAADFHARLSGVSWVLNAYNIVFAAFLVGGGQLADLLGRRRIFTAALVLFTLASIACAGAPSLGFLVGARVFQAAGAAMLVPASLAIVLQAHAPSRRMHAVSLWAAVAALAAGIGPPLGGLLITASDWRLVFVVNVPVGVVAYVLASRLLVESRAPGRRRVPDLLGGATLALAIGAVVLAVVKGQEWGWGSTRIVASFGLAALLAAYFASRTARHRAPVFDLALLRVRAFAVSNAVTIIAAAGFFGYTLCNVLFLTSVWRYSILQAGLALMPGPFVAMAVATPASRAVERIGHRLVLIPGALVWAAGVIFFATSLDSHPDFLGRWLPGMVILGVGAGLTFPTLSGAAVGSVPGPRFALATSLNSVARQLGAALGVAVLTAIVGNPSPADAIHAFDRGWTFAAGCFVAAAIASLGIAVARSEEADAAADSELLPGARAHTGDEAELEDPRLPGLAEAEGSHAETSPQTVGEFLQQVPVFAGLRPDLLDEVAALADDVQLARGELMFAQGDPADAVYIVRVGHVEILREDDDGHEKLNTRGRGAVLGELALLSDSVRSASVRALRDSQLIRIERAGFEALMRSQPELALGLTRTLSAQLQASRALPAARRAPPVTIALCPLGEGADVLGLADELSEALCAFGRVAVLHAGPAEPDSNGNSAGNGDGEASSGAGAAARFAPVVEDCERDHDQVLLVCRGDPGARMWDEFCVSRADRVLAVAPPRSRTGNGAGAIANGSGDQPPGAPAHLRGSELVGYDIEPGSGELTEWVPALAPGGVFAIARGSRRADVARMARRLSGIAPGLVLSGGGARAFAHLGVLEALGEAGAVIDRVGGVSMGAFIGGLVAAGLDSAAIDACCYEEWVRRNPINDYTIPRASLIKGQKAEAMLERTFGEMRIEDLSRPFYCASVNLRGATLVIESDGALADVVGASICLPLIAPPRRRDGMLLMDGSLLDNLPLAPMSESGEGPVLAIDVKGGEAPPRREAGAAQADDSPEAARARRRRHERLPSLPETMARVALLSSTNTDAAARRWADFTIQARVSGVGLLEFHQIDQARAAGRAAALEALEHAPSWLTAGPPPGSLAGRRTVLRVSAGSTVPA